MACETRTSGLPFGRFRLRFLLSALAMLLGVLPATAAAQTPTVVRIGTLPGLRFDTSAFFVRPGAEIELVFSNSDEMIHNLVITRVGARERVVQAAISLGAGAADRDFVPPSPDVLFATKVVATGQAFTLKFTAPKELGDYPYVCTLPGHGILMFGTMTVTTTPRAAVKAPLEMPAPATTDHSAHTGAPVTRGTVMRGFMPEAGPASIAVQLPGGVSYVWDSGAGRFRYAWTGGYMTMPASPERGLARINGEIFYREAAFPLRIGNTPGVPPKLVEFKGYTLDGNRIPEFETSVDGVSVRERVEVTGGRLVRRFLVAGAATVWFRVPEGVVGLEVPGGTREGEFYKLTGALARQFTVTYAVPSSPAAPAAAR